MEVKSPITGRPFHECIPTLRQRKIKITVNVKGLPDPVLSGVSTGGVMSGFGLHMCYLDTHTQAKTCGTPRPPLEKWSRGTHRVES